VIGDSQRNFRPRVPAPPGALSVGALTTLLILAAGRLVTGAEPAPRPEASMAAYAGELAYCAAQTNEYRASIGRLALVRSAVLEAYAATAAPHDGAARAVHRYFRRTRGGGVAFAENQVPWWPLGQFGSVREVMRSGLAMMWAEGRGGGHYDNIVGPYTQVGCGVFVDGANVTVVQAFR
jgi:hypothetical protein